MHSKAELLYPTSDLHLASFLRCRGFDLRSIDRDGDRTIFVFTDSGELRTAVVDYANDDVVPVRSFCGTLRDLKALTRDAAGRVTGGFGG